MGRLSAVPIGSSWPAIGTISSASSPMAVFGKYSLPFGPKGYEQGWKQSHHPDPVRLNMQGKDWRAYLGLGDCDLIIKDDGSLWAWGHVPPVLFGTRPLGEGYGYNFTVNPLRIGE